MFLSLSSLLLILWLVCNFIVALEKFQLDPRFYLFYLFLSPCSLMLWIVCNFSAI